MTSQANSGRKCYRQACPVATALDVAGDRWTFLLLRELLGGPARFQELLDGLPGVARNLLSTRLRRLESDGIVHRVNAHGSSLYALTELGLTVRPVVEALGFWGARLERVAPVEHQRSIRAIAMALEALLVRSGALGEADRYAIQLDVDGEHIEIQLGESPTATARFSSAADARIRVPAEVVAAFLSGEAFEADRFSLVSGDPGALEALLAALGGRRAAAAVGGE